MTEIELVHSDSLSCEAIFRTAPDGHFIVVSQCGGAKEPDIGNRVYIFHSHDKGKTWSSPNLVTLDNGRAQYQTEVAVVHNEILIFMTEHDGSFNNSRSYVLSSNDNGHTFSEKVIFPLKKGLCFIRGMIQVGEEYWFPYQHYEIGDLEDRYLHDNNLKIWNSNIEFVKMGVIKTKDFEHYLCSNVEARLPLRFEDKKKWVWSEPTLGLLPDHRVLMLLRNDARGFLYQSFSDDQGLTWSNPVKTSIPNPANKPKLIQLGGELILLNTPKSENGYSNRNPLAMWISSDGFNSCRIQKNLVEMSGWISYPDGILSNDKKNILFAFEYNRKDIYFVKADLT